MINRRNFLAGTSAVALATVVIGASSPAAAAYYSRRRPIEIIVPFSSGAGSDVASRMLAPFFSKHIEGNPPVQPVNVPGAAGVMGVNQFAFKRHDGHTLLVTASSVWIQWLLGNTDVQFNLADTVPILGFPGNTIMSISPTTGFKTGKDLLSPAQPLVMGASDPTGGHVRLILAFELLKVADKIKFVFGYDGGGATRLAFEQGEANLTSQATAAHIKNMTPLVQSGKAIPLFQLGVLDAKNEMVRDPVFPDIPTVRERYVEMYGEEPSGPLYESVKLFGGVLNYMQTAYLVHADAPPEAIEALRASVDKMVKDPELVPQMEKVLGSDAPIYGEEAERFRRRIRDIKPETLTFVRKLMTEKYGAKGLKL